ncbi:MAG: methyltransferase domain-containing protein [Clostridia bacterium]|nr:methyltransferase domain-containing protein [Clostridia bacterium]
MLICPVCSLPLLVEERSARCEKGHSFDLSKEGYLNLLVGSSSRGHGDDKKMLLDRRAFLEKGYYAPLLLNLEQVAAKFFPQGGTFLDAGCGEGYYTEGVLCRLAAEGKEPCGFGFDISKEAVRLSAKKLGGLGRFFVASTYHIPVATESVDLLFSLFAPYAESEFLRVLKPGGILVRAVPLEDHLYSLKEAVYENPTRNLTAAEVGKGFLSVDEIRVKKDIFLDSSEDILHLFGMTPYAHKTSPEDMEKLAALESLHTEMDIGILIYEKR